MEVNFSLVQDPVKSKKRMMKIITQVDARMKSRFMRGTYLPTLNIIASSKDSEQSFLEEFIQKKQKTESKNTLIVDEPQWVVDARKDSKEKFYVAIGNKLLPNELLPLNPSVTLLNEYEAKGYKLWKVPIGYLDTFQLNLDEAICSIIGIATAATLKYISGQKVAQAKVNTYENPFVKDIITVGNAKEDYTQYFDYFDMSKVSATDLEKPLYIHVDHSLSGDKTGVAGVWIIGKEATVQANTNSEFSNEALKSLASEINQDLHFKLAFSVSIAAPKGDQVSFSKTRAFIRWLTEQGFDIKGISMDTYQSANLKQDLIGDGYNVTIQSVDRIQTEPGTSRKICLPYHFLKTIINERRIQIYQKCDLLTEELTSLEREADGHINHPENGKYGSKDQADALCGAAWLASQASEEFGYNFGEQIFTKDDEVVPDNSTQFKQQLKTSFEEELNKMYIDKLKSNIDQDISNNYSQEEIEEYNIWKDIKDGIICF